MERTAKNRGVVIVGEMAANAPIFSRKIISMPMICTYRFQGEKKYQFKKFAPTVLDC